MTDYEKLRKAIDKKLSLNPKFRAVIKRINGGKTSFADTSSYAQITALAVGNELSAEVLSLADREGVCTQLLQDSYDDINEVCARVQGVIDEDTGINIRPQRAEFPAERVRQIAHSLIDPTVADEVIQRRADKSVANVAMSFHDDYIKANASFRNDAGLRCYITRIASAETCKWCAEVSGKFRFGDQPEDVFRRHDSCDCIIIYDNQVLRGKINDEGESSKTWEEIGEISADFEPTVFNAEQAQRLQNERLMGYKGLTSGANGGKIESKQGQDYSVAGLLFVSHRDELYQFAKKVPALPDYEDIVFHADRHSFLILNPETGDIEKRLSPKDVANLLRNSNNYGGGDIRLLSCQSGYGGDNSIAQELANELNVKVLAPTEILAIDNTGKTFISDNQLLLDMWGNGENVVETGKWEIFNPNKENG